MAFLQNAWYMIGWAHELKDGAFVHRTVAEHPMLIYRLQDGAPAAIRDRCPHRFVPTLCWNASAHSGSGLASHFHNGYSNACGGGGDDCGLVRDQPVAHGTDRHRQSLAVGLAAAATEELFGRNSRSGRIGGGQS